MVVLNQTRLQRGKADNDDISLDEYELAMAGWPDAEAGSFE